MAVMLNDDIDVELLRDKPTLFYERLCYFLSADDADRVLAELAFICHGCWDGEHGACKCSDGLDGDRVARELAVNNTSWVETCRTAFTQGWDAAMVYAGKKASEGINHLGGDECCHFQD